MLGLGALLRFLCAAIFVLSSWCAVAHEDFDLGIESVQLDASCRASITVVNRGRALPKSFYTIDSTAAISLTKGSQQERMPLLGQQDKNRDLQKPGGRLTIVSEQIFADNPLPLVVELNVHGEFADHGGDNNRLEVGVDCIKGAGQIPGVAVKATRPDLAITNYHVAEQNCQLVTSLKNLTGVDLPEAAWGVQGGAVINIMSLDTMESIAVEPLNTVDPSRELGLNERDVVWAFDLSRIAAKRIRVALWYVPDDLDFKNNQIEVDVPEGCQS